MFRAYVEAFEKLHFMKLGNNKLSLSKIQLKLPSQNFDLSYI